MCYLCPETLSDAELKNNRLGTGEVAEQFRGLTALGKDRVPSTPIRHQITICNSSSRV